MFSSRSSQVSVSFRALFKPSGWEFTRDEDEFVLGRYLREANRVVERHGLTGDAAERLFAMYARAARERREIVEDTAVLAARDSP